MPKWVDLVSFDGVRMQGEVVVRCVLEADGSVRLEGQSPLVDRLKAGIAVSPHRKVMPDEGEEFLRALGREFHNAYLFATDIQDKPEIEPYRTPPLQEIRDDRKPPRRGS